MSDRPEVPPTECGPVEPDRRIGAKAWISRDGEVLVIRERRADGSTFWTLPGGGVAPPEPVRTGLARELQEELQCQAIVGRPIDRCTYEHSTLAGVTTEYTVFRTRLLTPPSPNPREDVLEMAWTAPAAPPQSMLAPFRRVFERARSRP